MKKEQLEEWLLTHDQPDEWWLAIDGETKNDPVRVSDAVAVKEHRPEREVYLMHVGREQWVQLDHNPTITVSPGSRPSAEHPKEGPGRQVVKRKPHVRQSGAGLICFLLGLLISAVSFPIGLIIGIPMMLGIFATKRTYSCGACGNAVLNTSEFCPSCRAKIYGTELRVMDFILVGFVLFIVIGGIVSFSQ